MKQAPLLDTHIWIWWLLGDARMPPEGLHFLDNLPSDNRPFISDISLWELALLVELGRLELDRPLENFLKIAASPKTVQLCRIDAATVVEMNRLPDTFHRDPADRLIVATARVRNLELVTQDQRIVNSRIVPVWKF